MKNIDSIVEARDPVKIHFYSGFRRNDVGASLHGKKIFLIILLGQNYRSFS
jgi:hypothetical protein